jgi:Fe-S-cluster-containing dehydrogenase component
MLDWFRKRIQDAAKSEAEVTSDDGGGCGKGSCGCKSNASTDADTGRRLEKMADTRLERSASRRGFLKVLGATTATTAAVAATASTTTGCSDDGWDKFFQKNYRKMTPEDKERVFARITEEEFKTYGKRVELEDLRPIPGVRFAFCISLSACNGNRACVEACVRENNQSRDPAIQYIKVIELERGSFDLEKGTQYYEGKSVPEPDKVYLPMQCNQCDNPPCVEACPVGATWSEEDGIVVIDYDWCIGCRYCMAACPYEARRFNFSEPKIAPDELNTNQAYLGNRPRPKGVVEKCTFCLQRTRRGAMPACQEACPTGARKFGNLNDPDSEVSKIIREKPVFVLKEELNTIPKIFYYFE